MGDSTISLWKPCLNGVRKVLRGCWSPFSFPTSWFGCGEAFITAYQYGFDPFCGVVACPRPLPLPVQLLTSGCLVPFVWIGSGSLRYVVSSVWI